MELFRERVCARRAHTMGVVRFFLCSRLLLCMRFASTGEMRRIYMLLVTCLSQSFRVPFTLRHWSCTYSVAVVVVIALPPVVCCFMVHSDPHPPTHPTHPPRCTTPYQPTYTHLAGENRRRYGNGVKTASRLTWSIHQGPCTRERVSFRDFRERHQERTSV